MNDLTTLDEAFAELERRADSYVPGSQQTSGGHRPSGGPRRALLAAASVAAVAAVATTAALLAGNDNGTNGNGSTTTGLRAGAPTHSSAAAPKPTRPAVTGSAIPIAPATPTLGTSRTPTVGTARPASGHVPQNAAQLAQRLRDVLGSRATFVSTAPAGKNTPYIVGTLTRTSPRRVGGFDIQVDIGSPGDKAICEDPGESRCTVRRLADHSSLSIGREHRGDTLYLVDLVKPNGISLLMHVSNNSDPKGGGTVTSSTPPLSTSEMVKLLESPKWLG